MRLRDKSEKELVERAKALRTDAQLHVGGKGAVRATRELAETEAELERRHKHPHPVRAVADRLFSKLLGIVRR